MVRYLIRISDLGKTKFGNFCRRNKLTPEMMSAHVGPTQTYLYAVNMENNDAMAMKLAVPDAIMMKTFGV